MNEFSPAAEAIRERFIFLATELTQLFPALDLRFNLRSGTSNCRVFAGALSCRIVELDLERDDNPEELLHDAIWEIKRLAGLFDA